MSENLFEIYRTELLDAEEPGKVLRRLYWELFDLSPNRADTIMINKLIRIYGRWNVFFAMIEMFGIQELRLDKPPYGLFKTIIERKLREEGNPLTASDVDLTSLSRKRRKQVEQFKEEAEQRRLPESYKDGDDE